MAQLVKRPTHDVGSGHDLLVCEIESCIQLCTDSTETAWDSLSLSTPLLLTHSLSLSNKYFLKKIVNVYLFLRQRETEHEPGRVRERETQNLKQAPGSELSVSTLPNAGLKLVNRPDQDLSQSRTLNLSVYITMSNPR